MKQLKIAGAVLAAAALAACGSSDSTPAPTPTPTATPTPTPTPFQKPAGTIGVTFSVDDTANKVFKAGELRWKGSMAHDSTTRKVTLDSTWTGPFATLYDDGPYTVSANNHEGPTGVAGDNKWSVTVFVTPPATGSATYEYGCIDQVYETNFGNGWIWVGSNGTFTVNAGQTTDITAPGLVLPAFGHNDIQLKIDTSQLITGTWDTSKVTIKSSAWGWSEITLPAPTSGTIRTLRLGEHIGAGKTYVHTGLMKSGDQPEFIFVFNGKEYKDASGTAATGGVSAEHKLDTASTWTAATVQINATNKNTYISIP